VDGLIDERCMTHILHDLVPGEGRNGSVVDL
jgi:hypothetical protein